MRKNEELTGAFYVFWLLETIIEAADKQETDQQVAYSRLSMSESGRLSIIYVQEKMKYQKYTPTVNLDLKYQ